MVGFDFEVGDDDDDFELGLDFEAEALVGAGEGEAAEDGWCDVVWVAFCDGAELEELFLVEGFAGEFVEAHEDAEADGDAAAEAA